MTAPDRPPDWARWTPPPAFTGYPAMPPPPDQYGPPRGGGPWPGKAADGGWQKLDPRSILTYPFAQGGPLVFVVVVAALAGGPVDALLVRLGATVGSLVVVGFVHWWRFRYRLIEGRLETRAGLIARRSKVINVDRIRGVEIEAKLAHRLTGLCALRVEHPGAAGGSRGRNRDGRDRIDAITRAEGERLRTALLHERALWSRSPAGATPPAVATERVLLRMPTRWLFYGPFSVRLLLVGPVAVLGLFSSFNEAGVHADRLLGSASNGAGWIVSVVIAVGVVVLAAVLAAVLGYWHWAVAARGDDLVLSGGLLTRRVVAIERRRLRGVILREPLLGRPVSAASVHVVLSGVTGSVRSALVPLGPRRELERFAHAFVAPCTVAVAAHPRGALRRRLRRSVAPGVVLAAAAAVVAVVDRPVALALAVAAVVLVLLGLQWGRASYRALGHAFDARVLTAGHGVLVRHSETVDRRAPIGLRVRQSIFARRAGVASVDVALVARGFTRISDMAAQDVASLAGALLPGLTDLMPTPGPTSPPPPTSGRGLHRR